MAQGRLESATSFTSSELHSARQNRAVFLSEKEAVIYPKTFEDIVEWMSRKQDWFRAAGPYRNVADKTAAREAYRLEYLAKKRVYIDIDWHDKTSGGSDEAYGELLDKFYQARLQVKEPKGLNAIKSSIDRLTLGEMLIRHKLVSCLSAQGLKVRHAPLEASESGVDLVVPISSGSKDNLKIWIQPGPSNSGEISGVPHSSKSMLLYVPLRYGSDMAPLGQEEVSTLANTLESVYSTV
jgi:hypothetical protein